MNTTHGSTPSPANADGVANSKFEAPFGRVGRARVALLTIIDEEFSAVQDVFGLTQHVPNTPYFADSAERNDWDVVLYQSTDRTNVPVSDEVARVMEELRPQLIILVGVAGGLCDKHNQGRDGIHVGDVLIADYVSYVEFLKFEGGNIRMRSYAIDHPSHPLRRIIAVPLSKKLKLRNSITMAPPGEAPLKIHIGSIVSAEKVLGDVKNTVQTQLLEPFDKALAIDMESIGVARAVCVGRDSFWYHPRYAIIRGISDMVAAPDNDEMRASWKPFAAHTAAVVAKEFVTAFLPQAS